MGGNIQSKKASNSKKQEMLLEFKINGNPKGMTNDYEQFLNQVGRLTFVKYLNGNGKTDEQLILYQARDNRFEVMRIFYPNSYNEISTLFENPPAEIKKFLSNAFQQYYKMKISGLSLH